MRQAWHILKKDIRHLRIEIGAVVMLAAVFGWMHHRTDYPWWALLAVAATYLIVRVIHAEAIPGDDQFWITRPYRWGSLIGAKLAFIVLCVNLPVFIAQLIVFVRDGFPVVPNLPGLLWSFGLMLFGVAFPIAALAALTSGIMPFILSGILVVAIAGSILQNFRLDGGWPQQVEWIRYSTLVLLVMAVAAWALYAQYKTRRTFLSRTIVVSVVAFALALSWQAPVEWALAFQSRFSAEQFDSASFRVELNPQNSPQFNIRVGTERVPVSLPFAIRNVPGEMEVRMDFLNFDLVGPDGEVWSSGAIHNSGDWLRANGFPRMFAIPRRLYDAWHNGTVTVRGVLHLTAFGNSRRHSVTLSDNPVDVISGVQCFTEEFVSTELRIFSCRSPFRSPRFSLLPSSEAGPLRVLMPVSYSPFPASIDLNRVWLNRGIVSSHRFVNAEFVRFHELTEGLQITLAFREPVSHFRRDFQMTIDLDDYLVQ